MNTTFYHACFFKSFHLIFFNSLLISLILINVLGKKTSLPCKQAVKLYLCLCEGGVPLERSARSGVECLNSVKFMIIQWDQLCNTGLEAQQLQGRVFWSSKTTCQSAQVKAAQVQCYWTLLFFWRGTKKSLIPEFVLFMESSLKLSYGNYNITNEYLNSNFSFCGSFDGNCMSEFHPYGLLTGA